MKKKFLLLLLLVLSVFLFVGCSNNSGKELRMGTMDDIKDIVKYNANDEVTKHYQCSDFVTKTFEGETSMIETGIYRFENSSTSTMLLYSSYSDKIIYTGYPSERTRTVKSEYFPVYIYVITQDGKTKLFDIYGDLVFEKPFICTSMRITSYEENDYIKEIIHYDKVDENGITRITREEYKYNMETKSRFTDITADTTNPEQFTKDELEELADYGLPGYYFSESGRNVIIFDAEKNIINLIELQYTDNVFLLLMGKYLYIQSLTEAAPESLDYDLINKFGNKYYIDTKKMNILTGESKKVTINNVLLGNNFECCFDKKGKLIGALCDGFKIKNRTMGDPIRFFVDKDGNPEFQLPFYFDLDDIKKFGSHYLVNDVYFNSNMEIESIFGDLNHFKINNHSFDTKNLVVRATYAEKVGLLDENLNVVIPFEYDDLNTSFENNYIARKDDQIIYFDKHFNEIKIKNYTELTAALAMDYNFHNGECKIYPFDSNITPLEFVAANVVKIDYAEVGDTTYAFFHGTSRDFTETTLYKMEITMK